MSVERVQNPGEEPSGPSSSTQMKPGWSIMPGGGWWSWSSAPGEGWRSGSDSVRDLIDTGRQMMIHGEAMRAAGQALKEAAEREAREAAEREEEQRGS